MQYKELVAEGEIRVIKLLPHPIATAHEINEHDSREPDQALVLCELSHANRNDRTQKYAALSYVWGNPKDQTEISIDGELVSVGSNLATALQHLRREDEDLILWVDQICINQLDDAEKSQQVRQMKEIYEQASVVYSWLGVEDENSHDLLALLRELGRAWAVQDFARINNLYKATDKDALHAAWRSFCIREYWRRLWILQELAVAHELVLVCGKTTIDIRDFSAFMTFLTGFMSFPDDHLENNDNTTKLLLRDFKQVYRNEGITVIMTTMQQRELKHGWLDGAFNSLFDVLGRFAEWHVNQSQVNCSDSRDRVFGVLGLANDGDVYNNLVDYSSSSEEVYAATTRRLLELGKIDVLGYCQNTISLASWIPDYDKTHKRRLLLRHTNPGVSASRNCAVEQDIQFPDSSTVSLMGMLVDMVEEVDKPFIMDLFDPELSLVDTTVAFLKVLTAFFESSPRHAADVNPYGIWLRAGRVAIVDALNVPGTIDLEPEYMKKYFTELYTITFVAATYREVGTTHAANNGELINSSYGRNLQASSGCRPLRSTSGYVGIGPPETVSGDKIVVFAGARMPYVLRDAGDGVYTLVGEAYIDGVMFGELMQDDLQMERVVLR